MNAHPGQFREALPDALDAYWRVAGFLKPQHFAEGIHRKVPPHIQRLCDEFEIRIVPKSTYPMVEAAAAFTR